MRIVLTRHGATAGNAEKRYCGAGTDEALSATGIEALKGVGSSDFSGTVYTSGMLRTEQTARILYPQARIDGVFDLREMEFGAFEGKNYLDLACDERYRAWVEGGCVGCCPKGEDRESFVKRCCEAFKQVVASEARQGNAEARFVVHGGTIMAIMSGLSRPQVEYFSIKTLPGGSWIVEWDGSGLCRPQSFESGLR